MLAVNNLIGFGCPAVIETAVSQAAGTAIGNMTVGAGHAGAFDGNTNQANAASAVLSNSASDGTIGKDWGASTSRVIASATYYGCNDIAVARDNSNVNTSVNAFLEGSPNNSAWTTLDTQTTGTSTSAVIVFRSASPTAYRYHRVRVAAAGSSGDVGCAELVFTEYV